MGPEWVFPFLTRFAPPHKKTDSDPVTDFSSGDVILIKELGVTKAQVLARLPQLDPLFT